MQVKSARAQLHHELSRFIIIGIIATLFDFSLYSIGHRWLNLPYAMAKTFSFICGSCLAYFLNKHFTFKQEKHQAGQMLRFVILYVLTMLVNVAVNSSSIALLTQKISIAWLTKSEILIFSFVIATGTSTVLNFIGQKFWVFKSAKQIPEFV
ncbi:MAG: GtrA family protein [Gammaproteobacteria bacterium]|jgi:putative flippase GtrA|nr:GtrA family protein [Gammaproteobacteria bacterium]